MISLALSFADIWARRPRVALTTSFQVHHDTVMVQIDMLHWGLDFGQASRHLDQGGGLEIIAAGPRPTCHR